MRSNCVVSVLPGEEASIQGGDLQVTVISLVELPGMGALGPFHMAVTNERAIRYY